MKGISNIMEVFSAQENILVTVFNLTKRQIMVLRMSVEGKKTAEIAEALGVTTQRIDAMKVRVSSKIIDYLIELNARYVKKLNNNELYNHFSPRVVRLLNKEGIYQYKDVLTTNLNYIKSIPGLGKKAFDEISEKTNFN